jgi:2-polyprenyl-3-methyl-5-hydroxy-6-metoxy-1,4-benzoquinol methylase
MQNEQILLTPFAELQYEKHYARSHDFSDEYYALMDREYRKLLRCLGPQPEGARILDIGCGAGFAVSALLKLGWKKVQRIDSSPGLVQIANKRKLPVDLIPEETTERHLAQLQGTIDVALLLDVLEHLPYERQIGFLRSIKSALRPDGVFLCRVPNAMCINSSHLRWSDWTHRCLFTASSLTFALENAGFSVVTVSGAPGYPSPVRKGLMRVAMPVARTALQGFVNAFWRIALVSQLGISPGLGHPVSPNLLAVARPN